MWQPIATAPRDRTPILIKTNVGIVEAWYAPLEPAFDHEGNDNSWGDCWICYDDAFEIEVEAHNGQYWDGQVTHWMPLPPEPNTPEGANRDASTDTSHSRQEFSDRDVLAEPASAGVLSGMPPTFLVQP